MLEKIFKIENKIFSIDLISNQIIYLLIACIINNYAIIIIVYAYPQMTHLTFTFHFYAACNMLYLYVYVSVCVCDIYPQ